MCSRVESGASVHHYDEPSSFQPSFSLLFLFAKYRSVYWKAIIYNSRDILSSREIVRVAITRRRRRRKCGRNVRWREKKNVITSEWNLGGEFRDDRWPSTVGGLPLAFSSHRAIFPRDIQYPRRISRIACSSSSISFSYIDNVGPAFLYIYLQRSRRIFISFRRKLFVIRKMLARVYR